MLTKREQREAKNFAAGMWALLRYDPETCIETWVQKEPIAGGGYKLHVMEKQNNIPQILDHNTNLRSAQGADWAKRKNAPIIGASIPTYLDNELKRQCGQDETGQYDKKKYKRILNDVDFRKLRTVDGRI